ncbi:hypothetical protein [Pseudomonas sp. NBRC 111123]|uniref:hypothetical protein n=1 Tax=Pseudomonas sp. NBRC 111123 TaxID=1661038 RepID=UPI000AE79309|nr:hypothetical protein [Pseudomonas sp. NBRC 111123]
MSDSAGKRPAVNKGQPKLRPIRIHHAQPLALSAPGVDTVMIADPADNTVKVEYLEDDSKVFRITIPTWVLAPPGRYDTLVVRHVQSGTPVLENEFNRDDADKFPLAIEFNRAQLDAWSDGVNSFDYQVMYYNGMEDASGPLDVRFDRKPPYDKAYPAAFPVIANITDANMATVKLSLPDYPDRADGDKVFWFWLNEVPAEGEDVDPDGFADVGKLPQDIPVPADVIRARGDGGIYALYVLMDKAGNVSRISAAREVGVAVGPLPGNLKDPVVNAAADGVIDQQDVFDGIVVQVLAFDNAKPTDQVRVIWGSDESEWREVGSLNAFPMDFRMTPKVVWDSYGGSSKGEVAVTVAYEVRRGTVPQGGRGIEVMVNLERIGPVGPGPDPDPEWPDPVNPRLPLPAVYGKVSDTENELLPVDEFENARLMLVIDKTLQEKDELTFYWDDAHLDSLDYPLASDDIGEEVEFEVPWAAIAARGNDIVPVHYKVRRPGNPNVVGSDTVDVDVTAIDIHPEKPEFLGGNTGAPVGWLTCGALYDEDNPDPLDPAIRVRVPDLAQYGLKAGDTVTLKWTAVQGFVGETVIPGVALEEAIELTATNINGFVWRVQPYEDHILPIYDFAPPDHDGRGRVHYEFKLAGRSYVSDIEEQVVSMHGPSGSCPLKP